MKRVWMMLLSAGMLACGSDEGPTGPAGSTTATTGATTAGGANGSTAGGATTTGSTAGPTTGGPAMTTTTGGTTGTTSATTGQPTTGTTGPMVDAGGGAIDAGPAPTDPCANVDTGMAAGSQAAAAAVLTEMTPCGFSSCHGDVAKGGLTLLDSDLQKLVDQPSCEAPLVPLIDGSGGAEALENSWVWLKLTTTTGADNALMGSEAEWGAPGACGQPGDQPYGQSMPLGAERLSEDRLTAIRNWICLGAPAP